MEQNLREIPQPVEKYHGLYGSREIVTVFTEVRDVSLFQTTSVQFKRVHSISFRSTAILSHLPRAILGKVQNLSSSPRICVDIA